MLEPDGREVIRAGGVWDGSLQCYVVPPQGFEHRAEVVTLEVSQVPLMRDLADWIFRCRRGDRSRPPGALAVGNRGSGKTFAVAGVFIALVALEWPGDEQIGVNLNSDNYRECVEQLVKVGRPEWVRFQSTDKRDLYMVWANDSRVSWQSAKNPDRLRMGGLPIRHVMLNEAHRMRDDVLATAQGAPRNLGGICTYLFNPPTKDSGNPSARLWFAAEAGERKLYHHKLLNKDNTKIDREFMDEAGEVIRVISPTIAEADVDGDMKMSGPIAYKSFDARPYNLVAPLEGGCVGEPPNIGWMDVTRALTSPDFGGDEGSDYVAGLDFQKRPGIIADIGKLWRTPPPLVECPLCGPGGCLVLHILDQVATPGMEAGISQALIDAGYTTNGYFGDGRTGPKILLVGDGTGDRQSADHRRWKPPSFHALTNDGWRIEPPMYHHKNNTPWNPDVPTSVGQMFDLFAARHVLLSPKLKQAKNGFPSLIDSYRNAKRWESTGRLRDDGEHMHHGPDGVRYLAWKYLPRPAPKFEPRDGKLAAELRSIRLTDR